MTVLSTFVFLMGCAGQKSKDSESKEGKAKVGVGKKGEGYGINVPLLKPASTFWKVKEKIAFDILIPKNVQLFQAKTGRKPKSHEEFMQEIVVKGKVKLPELDEGLEYYYDADKGELMVRNEAAKQSQQ